MSQVTQEARAVIKMLRARGFRLTPQREAIVEEVLRTAGHITPQTVARRVQRRMRAVNASTVYRTLALLEQVGVLKHAHLEGGPEYHRTGTGEHVHLTCSRCRADDDLSMEEAADLRSLIRKHRGFLPDLTHFAISGLCSACQAAARR